MCNWGQRFFLSAFHLSRSEAHIMTAPLRLMHERYEREKKASSAYPHADMNGFPSAMSNKAFLSYLGQFWWVNMNTLSRCSSTGFFLMTRNFPFTWQFNGSLQHDCKNTGQYGARLTPSHLVRASHDLKPLTRELRNFVLFDIQRL